MIGSIAMTPALPSWDQLQLVMPELWLIAAMCAVILVPFVKRDSVVLPVGAAGVGLGLAMLAALSSLTHYTGFGEVFSGMLTVDYFSQFFKVLLILFTGLVCVQWWITSRHQTHRYDVPDFFCLLLGAAVGMSLMASASNLLMIFIAMESASLPSYALAGLRKRYRVGSEGALKYVIFGSASSAVMLYGMSLIYGVTGTLSLAGVAQAAAGGVSPLMAIGLAAMLGGLAFKLSAVPLHFWCPDVFQGAPIEVTTFLSVASKGAAVCLLIRVLCVFGAASVSSSDLFMGLSIGIAILGAVTATWGNLVALHQTNIKRLLAYSSIAHAGYMIMGASLILVAADRQWVVTSTAQPSVVGAILFYLVVYLFMNLGAFTVVGMVTQQTGSEELTDYAGLMQRSPLLAVPLTLFLLSLFGMPGLGGFMGKIYLMQAMADAGSGYFVLIVVLLLNTVVSLYYYMRPVYYMAFVPDAQNRPKFLPQGAGLAVLLLCAVAVVWTGVLPKANEMARDYANLKITSVVPDPVFMAQAMETRSGDPWPAATHVDHADDGLASDQLGLTPKPLAVGPAP